MSDKVIDSQPLERQIIFNKTLQVTKSEDGQMLKIVYLPWKIISERSFLVLFMLFTPYALEIYYDGFQDLSFAVVFIPVVVVLSLLVFFLQRYNQFVSVFDLKAQKLSLLREGVLPYKQEKFSGIEYLDQIIQAGVCKQIQRGGDIFKLFLTVTKGEFELSDFGVSFKDAFLCAETIRDFLKLDRPIQTRD